MSLSKLASNSLLNIAGQAMPLLIAIPSMGMIARLLDIEQFGIFTLIFAIIGYSSIFDLGISRAVIREVARATPSAAAVRKILGTSTVIVSITGLIGTLLLLSFSTQLVSLLNISANLADDTEKSFFYVALCIPPLLLSSVWLSYLEGISNFRCLNLIRAFSGCLLSAVPLVFLLFNNSLSFAVLGLLISRIISAIIAFFFSLTHQQRAKIFLFDTPTSLSLFKFGSWITLSNIISPLMVYFDRILLSSVNGASSVAYYTGPSEAVTRLLFIPGAVSRVIFPLLSSKDRVKAIETKLSYYIVFVVCGLISIMAITFANWLIPTWLGDAYKGEAVLVFQILMVGFFFNSIAQIPYTVIQAAGHSRTTALLHLAEIVPYLTCLYFLIIEYGVVGAAYAWAFRVFVDCLALALLSRKHS